MSLPSLRKLLPGKLSRGKGRILALLLAAIIVVAALWYAVGIKPQQSTTAVANTAQYTGSAACKDCHEEVFNGWKTTFHAYKFRPADVEDVEFNRVSECIPDSAEAWCIAQIHWPTAPPLQ